MRGSECNKFEIPRNSRNSFVRLVTERFRGPQLCAGYVYNSSVKMQ